LDLFVAMQQYLTFIGGIERPSFKDINGSKCQDEYPGAYLTDTTQTFNAMSKTKSTSSGVITTGLWPLDHESYYDWHHSTHKKSIWTQWIYMARIKKIIVDHYCLKMFCKCPASAIIHDTLAWSLSALCSTTIITGPKSKKGDKAPERKFYWLDNIKAEQYVIQGKVREQSDLAEGNIDPKGKGTVPGKATVKVDIDELRAEQL
jgi:hypothetical protein